MWGALSYERTRLSFAGVTLSSNKSVVRTIYILHVIKCMYVCTTYTSLCQSRPSTADHALSLVDPATTAV
jgi:hypothetical protein